MPSPAWGCVAKAAAACSIAGTIGREPGHQTYRARGAAQLVSARGEPEHQHQQHPPQALQSTRCHSQSGQSGSSWDESALYSAQGSSRGVGRSRSLGRAWAMEARRAACALRGRSSALVPAGRESDYVQGAREKHRRGIDELAPRPRPDQTGVVGLHGHACVCACTCRRGLGEPC